jgi:hypothetical protein
MAASGTPKNGTKCQQLFLEKHRLVFHLLQDSLTTTLCLLQLIVRAKLLTRNEFFQGPLTHLNVQPSMWRNVEHSECGGRIGRTMPACNRLFTF